MGGALGRAGGDGVAAGRVSGGRGAVAGALQPGGFGGAAAGGEFHGGDGGGVLRADIAAAHSEREFFVQHAYGSACAADADSAAAASAGDSGVAAAPAAAPELGVSGGARADASDSRVWRVQHRIFHMAYTGAVRFFAAQRGGSRARAYIDGRDGDADVVAADEQYAGAAALELPDADRLPVRTVGGADNRVRNHNIRGESDIRLLCERAAHMGANPVA